MVWTTTIICVKVMLSITILLSNPNPDDPINWEAARVLRYDPEEYDRMARTMTRRQSNNGQRQVRSEGRNEEIVARPEIVEEAALEGEEQEEEVLEEVEAGAIGREEADAVVNPVDGEEGAAEVTAEWVDPADAEADHYGEFNDEEEANTAVEQVIAGGTDPAEDDENVEEGA